MSLAAPRALHTAASDRADLVALLNSLAGLTAYPTVPDQAVAGAAWPKWIQTTYDGHLCSVARHTYDVLVTLPAGYIGTTVDQGDQLRDQVAGALSAAGNRIQYAEPVRIQFQDTQQAMPGLRLRITTT